MSVTKFEKGKVYKFRNGRGEFVGTRMNDTIAMFKPIGPTIFYTYKDTDTHYDINIVPGAFGLMMGPAKQYGELVDEINN